MQPALEIRDLRISFNGDAKRIVAVDGVTLALARGKTTAVVGESGCGKSVTALSIIQLLPQPPARIESGRILLYPDADSAATESESTPTDLLRLPQRELRRIRGRRVAMVFQDPLGSLNPVYTVGEQICEAVELHQHIYRADARHEAARLLNRVGIPSPGARLNSYPHELSGGMRQRAMIAMALACRPEILIADEPTTALDVTVQAQILDLLRELQRESALTLLLITHDLGVVASVADYVYVMYAGRIVEHAPAEVLLRAPLHPYTSALLACTPRITEQRSGFSFIPGQVPDPINRPAGCAFHPRCDLTATRAQTLPEQSIRVPPLKAAGVVTPTNAADSPDACALPSETGHSSLNVLEHCVSDIPGRPSGVPPLREIHPKHFVACWEVQASL